MLYNQSLDVGHDECEPRAKSEHLTDLDGRAVRLGQSPHSCGLGARNGFTARSLPSPLPVQRTVVTGHLDIYMVRERKYQYDLEFELRLLLTFNDVA